MKWTWVPGPFVSCQADQRNRLTPARDTTAMVSPRPCSPGNDESKFNVLNTPFVVLPVEEPRIPLASSAGQLQLGFVVFGCCWILNGRIVLGWSCVLVCALLDRGPVPYTRAFLAQLGGSCCGRGGGDDAASPSAQISTDWALARFFRCPLSAGAARWRQLSRLLRHRLML